MSRISFIDTEVSVYDKKVHDYGAVGESGDKIHSTSYDSFLQFISDSEYICGHNIIDFDLKFITLPKDYKVIDTLYLSTLLFPNKPYHKLVKDDKLMTDQLNNPLNDAVKSKELFYDEINAFLALDEEIKQLYYVLLSNNRYFSAFFKYIGYKISNITITISDKFSGLICENAPLAEFINNSPVELAYCLALITTDNKHSLFPRWILKRFPKVEYILKQLTNTPCRKCRYCNTRLNPVKYLNKYFGYESFRTYEGEALQENAVNAAVDNKSLLAIFPTGGGKTLTFQIPALIAGETARALTVVISPLQSLMKDQVDNLEKLGIPDAVAINGLLSPIERAEAIDRVRSGVASILYIAPESLRSKTIENLLLERHINRFVIDEAHCFSAWGQDFRVDYLYIGDFIKSIEEKKNNKTRIPISCFTATAKPKVISDIKDYFKEKLDLNLELYATNAARSNLRYEVIFKETDEDKYDALRALIEQKKCPTIVFVSRTKRTVELAERLSKDGYKALPFNGKMASSDKQANQEAFINDEVQIIVATSAFGMGVDKSNVRLVIHYDISDSLENYIQEAGRAGRDQSINADCYILFNDDDLNKHFILLSQTKLSISEIQQVWKAIKDMTPYRPSICCSALEIARKAGWQEGKMDVETRVRTAINALESAGYIVRGKNSPQVYADSIIACSAIEANTIIDSSPRFTDDNRDIAKRIFNSLISSKRKSLADNGEAESRVDYLADNLGIEKSEVIHSIQSLREAGILADSKDITAYIYKSSTVNKSMHALRRFRALEKFLLSYMENDNSWTNYKKINDAAIKSGIKLSTVKNIRQLFYYWSIRNYVKKEQDLATDNVAISFSRDISEIKQIRQKSENISEFIIDYLFDKCFDNAVNTDKAYVEFSVIELKEAYNTESKTHITCSDIEEALLFLSKIGALDLEGGFLVLYTGMEITRLVTDNKIKYKIDDYKQLDEYYKLKIQQIHIVGEYANMMVKDYNAALKFVNDYFQLEYKKFISKYFSGSRSEEIKLNVTPAKYHMLFDELSSRQLEIINDDTSKHIVVSAGPGSGKTKLLVHKLAALLMLEDVKHEQLLMLTFSRAAAIEFKHRLRMLIGNAANYIEIKTFHSYCFDILGMVGSIGESPNVVSDALDKIQNNEVDPVRISKTVLVIDEAQDMDEKEYELVEALMNFNDDMRVIAVGDDDQNIYRFRGADSKYLKSFITEHGAKQYSLIDNYRSDKSVVGFANHFVQMLPERMKSEDIKPISVNNGMVRMVKHCDRNIELAVCAEVRALELKGSTCILTSTNEEALIVLGTLEQMCIPAKMIQSINMLRITDIAEIRYFLKKLKVSDASPTISNKCWNEAIDSLNDRYSESECLLIVNRILKTFEENYPKKYKSDLDMFLHESRIEDFYTDEQGVITVSTMHKSKGREYDNVFMLVKKAVFDDENDIRKLYVAMTRAKKSLYLHYCGDEFDRFTKYADKFIKDDTHYPKSAKIISQMTHEDVFLNFFKDKKRLILSLRSGDKLKLKGDKLYASIDGSDKAVLQFSRKYREQVEKYKMSGYVPCDAVIRYIMAWKGKEDVEENAIILADVHYTRVHN